MQRSVTVCNSSALGLFALSTLEPQQRTLTWRWALLPALARRQEIGRASATHACICCGLAGCLPAQHRVAVVQHRHVCALKCHALMYSPNPTTCAPHAHHGLPAPGPRTARRRHARPASARTPGPRPSPRSPPQTRSAPPPAGARRRRRSGRAPAAPARRAQRVERAPRRTKSTLCR